MSFKIFAFCMFLFVAHATCNEQTPNPKTITAMKAMIENGGFNENVETQGCNADQCPAGSSICCEQTNLQIWCCPSTYPNCFRQNGGWLCKAGAASLAVNFGIIALLAIFTIGKANIF